MASRLHIAEPSIDDLEASEDTLRQALTSDPVETRAAAGLKIAADWIQDREGSLDVMEERRLELAYARVLARDGSDGPDPMELGAIDYARTLLVDVSLQKEGEVALQMINIFDRRDHYNWLNTEHEGKPWHRAEISPSDFMNYTSADLAGIASGRFEELPSYHREGVEVFLIKGMSRRDDVFDAELYALHPHRKALDASPTVKVGDLDQLDRNARKAEADLYGVHPKLGGIACLEIEGVAERLTVARHADLYRDHSMSLYDARPGKNPFVVSDTVAERGQKAVQSAGEGFKRNRVEKAARVALEFQQLRGVPLDRAAFKRMESAAGRLIRMPDVGELSDLEAAKALIVDASIQKTASETLNPKADISWASPKSASQQILDDMLGRGTAPIFTKLAVERQDTEAVAAGRFADLTDDRGIGSMVRQAIYRSGRDVPNDTGRQLDRLDREIRIGASQDLGWIERKADKSVGANQLKSLSHGPTPLTIVPKAVGIER